MTIDSKRDSIFGVTISSESELEISAEDYSTIGLREIIVTAWLDDDQ